MAASFADLLTDHGERVALIADDGTTLTYAALAAAADAFAATLGEGRRLVLLSMANDIDSVVAYLGALRGGHAVILASDPDLAATRWLVEVFAPDLHCAGTSIVAHGVGGTAPHPDLAVLLSTSGSTGSAKLVRLSHTALDANARSIAEYLAIGPGERGLANLPLTYSYGLSVLNSHLAAGAAVVLTDRSVIDPAFWTLARDTAATSLAGVPYTYELLEKSGFRDLDLPALRTLTQAGGRLPEALATVYAGWAEATGRRFFVMYGQTEATARIAYLAPDDARTWPGAIGRAIPGGTLSLRAVDGQPGDVGELVYRGANVMMGYALARADVARGAELDELATGDLASEVAPGVFRIVGRLGRFAKIAGLRVGFDDVEGLLTAARIEAKVAGDDKLVVVALTDAGQRAAAETLIAERCTIPTAALAYVAIDDWPRLSSGKLDYATLIALGHAEHAAATARAGAGQSRLAAAFAPLRGGRPASPDDSFIGLGGDSLSYVQLSMAIEHELGTLPANWERLRLAELEALVPATDDAVRRTRTIAGEMVVRVAAITAVVIGHVVDTTTIKGGGGVLLMTAGYNLARFQGERIAGPERWSIVGSFLKRVILPAYLMILLIAGLSNAAKITLPTLLLISNYFGESRGPLLPFWFLETLLEAIVLIVGLYSIPPVRRFAVAQPWSSALAFVGLAMALKLVVPMLVTFPTIAGGDRTLDAWLYAFALGWLVATARTTTQKLFCVALGGTLAALDWALVESHTAWMLAAVAIVLFVPRLTLWRPLATTIAYLAQISFFIYITHTLAIQVVKFQLHIYSPALTLALAVVLGAVLYTVWNAALARIDREWRARVTTSARFPWSRDLPRSS